MHKLTDQQLKEVVYASISDFSQKFDQIEDFDDKLAFTTRYLLTHGAGRTPDYSFAAAVHFARMKLIDASAKMRKEREEKSHDEEAIGDEVINVNAENPKSDLEAEAFIGNPASYLKGYAQAVVSEIEARGVEGVVDERVKRNCQYLEQAIDQSLNDEIANLEQNSKQIDIMARLETKFGGRFELDEAYKATKPGLFSGVFGSASVAARNLDTAYSAFRNRNHALYGDDKAINKAAVEYIQHKIPSWKPGDELPKDADLANLSGSARARMDLSINIIKCVKEQEEMERYFRSITEACKEKNLQFSDISNLEKEEELAEESVVEDVAQEPVKEEPKVEEPIMAYGIDQTSFQASLAEELRKDDELIVSNDDVEEKDLEVSMKEPGLARDAK